MRFDQRFPIEQADDGQIRERRQKVRALFLSDVHLGTRASKSEKLHDFLRHHEAHTIYLVGDIVDGWRLRARWHWPQAHSDVIGELFAAAARVSRIVYLPGNRDAFLRDYPGSPLKADVAFWFAEHYRARKEFDGARGYYRSILELHPADRFGEEALYAIATSYLDGGDPGQAALMLEEFAKRFPGSTMARGAWRKMAVLSKEAGDIDSALVYFGKALGSGDNERNAQVQYEIAECYEQKGDLARAAIEYLRVPELYAADSFWSIRAELKGAQLLERTGDRESARKLYEKLAGMDIEESQFASGRLDLLGRRGDDTAVTDK